MDIFTVFGNFLFSFGNRWPKMDVNNCRNLLTLCVCGGGKGEKAKPGRGCFWFPDFWFRVSDSLKKENCHNSRTSDDIDMKLGPVTELDERNKTPSKILTMTSCPKFMTSLSFYRFMANLEQPKGRITDA